MARKATGQVISPKSRRRQKSWGIRFRAYGERYYVSDPGWDEAAARAELEYVLAAVERGHWQPPAPAPEAPPAPAGSPTFHEFASEWFAGLADEGLRPNTLADYEWQLTHHLLPFFERHTLVQVTIAEVDRYRKAKVREGALSAASINKTITRLGQVLEVAVERELIAQNPVRVNPRRRKLKESKPRRSTLDRADQIASLLDAAGELDAEARRDRRATSRRALLATLVLAGPRIGEALELRWRDVDLAAGRLAVRASKTDAGVREVALLPALRDELAALRATIDPAPGARVFGTETGGRQNPSNVRNRVLAPAIERANERRAEAGLAPLPEGLTPHSLRRTFISLLLALGEDVPYVMAQAGHTDPKVTLSIYAQVMFRGDGERERLRDLVEGADCIESADQAMQAV